MKPKINDQLVPLNLKDYDERYERAQLIERNLARRAVVSGSRFASSRDNRRFGKKSMTRVKYPIPPNRKNGMGKLAYNSN